MKYSNGFDLDVILPALTSRVGWRSENLVRSFESFHALCTETNLKDVQETPNIGNTDFTTYKTALKKDIIQRALSGVFNEPEYIEQVLLHTRIENAASQTFANNGLFCGFRIKIAKDFEKSVWIKNLTLLFNGDGTFNVYLFKLGKAAPIQTKSVTTVANTPTIVDLSSDNWVLNYGVEQATTFFIGYFQDDISVQAIREQVCMNCTKVFDAEYCQTSKTGSTTINQEQVSWSTQPYGLTAEIHSFRDYTQKIKNSAFLFDEVIGLQMVYFLLEQIVSSTRSNATERILKGSFEAIELKHYLYGSVPAMGVAKTTGLNELISQKMEQVRRSFNPKPKAVTVNLGVCS